MTSSHFPQAIIVHGIIYPQGIIVHENIKSKRGQNFRSNLMAAFEILKLKLVMVVAWMHFCILSN